MTKTKNISRQKSKKPVSKKSGKKTAKHVAMVRVTTNFKPLKIEAVPVDCDEVAKQYVADNGFCGVFVNDGGKVFQALAPVGYLMMPEILADGEEGLKTVIEIPQEVCFVEASNRETAVPIAVKQLAEWLSEAFDWYGKLDKAFRGL